LQNFRGGHRGQLYAAALAFGEGIEENAGRRPSVGLPVRSFWDALHDAWLVFGDKPEWFPNLCLDSQP